MNIFEILTIPPVLYVAYTIVTFYIKRGWLAALIGAVSTAILVVLLNAADAAVGVTSNGGTVNSMLMWYLVAILTAIGRQKDEQIEALKGMLAITSDMLHMSNTIAASRTAEEAQATMDHIKSEVQNQLK